MPFGVSTSCQLQESLITLSMMFPGEEEEGEVSLGLMSPGKGEAGAVYPEGMGAEGWHLHSPGHHMEEAHKFGAMLFPSLKSCPEATYIGKKKKPNNHPTKEVGKRILKPEEADEVSSFIPSGQWHRSHFSKCNCSQLYFPPSARQPVLAGVINVSF